MKRDRNGLKRLMSLGNVIKENYFLERYMLLQWMKLYFQQHYWICGIIWNIVRIIGVYDQLLLVKRQ